MKNSIGTITVGPRTFAIQDIEEIKAAVSDYDEEETAGYAELPGDTIEVGPAGLLVTDPVYIADVFNDFGDPSVAYLWQHALILCSEAFGPIVKIGDDILFFYGLEEVVEEEPEVLSEGIGGDSGSVILLPLSEDIPPGVHSLIDADDDKEIIHPPPGRYRVGVMECASDEEDIENIVLRRVS